MRRHGARLADVAAAAGVSTATASKAINGRGRISADTRQRVLESARALGFLTSSGQGRRPFTTVGLLATDLSGRFALPILNGIEDALGTERSAVFLCNARGDSFRERHQLAALLDRRVDGIVVVGRPQEREPVGYDLPVPVIYVHTHSRDPRDTSLVVDNVQGSELQIEHLIAAGRRRIGHIGGPASELVVSARKQGVVDALHKHGLKLEADAGAGLWRAAWGRSAVTRMLAAHPDLDAIVCDSDDIALGVVDQLKSLSVRIPDDVAVVGFGNYTPLVTNTDPEITSIDVNFELLGREAARILHAAIEGEEPQRGVIPLPCELIPRASTTSGL